MTEPCHGPRARASRREAAREDAGRILLVAAGPTSTPLGAMLADAGHDVRIVPGVEAAEPMLRDPDLDAVVAALVLGERSGLELLERARCEDPDLAVIVVADPGSIETAVLSMRRGAFDYLPRPLDAPRRLLESVRRALARRRLARCQRSGPDAVPGDGAPDLVGESAAMRALKAAIASLRERESSVLLQGESGTGKELVARALHAASPRAAGPFVAVDCGALPEAIAESELFGHERGAFTGAVGARGLFRGADGGTLFLDEIGELPPAIQAKLLRALQQREVRPVGGGVPVPVDLRVIAATHRDLRQMVQAGRFRADLYYRLDVVRIELPPLRARRDDVPALVHHLLRRAGAAARGIEGVETEALEALMAHDWPGNVRELENVIEAALARARGPLIRSVDLPFGRRRLAPAPSALPLSLEAYERCALERALAETGGDATRAARLLGLGRSTFYRKLGKHGIARTAERADSPVRERGTGGARAFR